MSGYIGIFIYPHIPIYKIKAISKLDNIFDNLNDLHELGRQRAFELGNPFYSKYSGDGIYTRKELLSGEMFLALVEFTYDE